MECGFYVYKGLLCEICSYDAAFTQKCFEFLVRSSRFEVRGSGVLPFIMGYWMSLLDIQDVQKYRMSNIEYRIMIGAEPKSRSIHA